MHFPAKPIREIRGIREKKTRIKPEQPANPQSAKRIRKREWKKSANPREGKSRAEKTSAIRETADADNPQVHLIGSGRAYSERGGQKIIRDPRTRGSASPRIRENMNSRIREPRNPQNREPADPRIRESANPRTCGSANPRLRCFSNCYIFFF